MSYDEGKSITASWFLENPYQSGGCFGDSNTTKEPTSFKGSRDTYYNFYADYYKEDLLRLYINSNTGEIFCQTMSSDENSDLIPISEEMRVRSYNKAGITASELDTALHNANRNRNEYTLLDFLKNYYM